MKYKIIISAAALLASCVPKYSPEYEMLRKTQGVDPIEYAEKLPLDSRIDLYQETYDQLGHPADASLAFAFRNEGPDAFYAVTRRMTTSTQIYSLIWILVVIDAEGGVNACVPPYSTALTQRFADAEMAPSDLTHISFTDCEASSLVRAL